MQLALLRHGVAEDAGPSTEWRDEPRRLTDAGRRRMRDAAAGIVRLGLTFDLVLTSPLTRCAQTAEIVGDARAVPAVDAAADRRVRRRALLWLALVAAAP